MRRLLQTILFGCVLGLGTAAWASADLSAGPLDQAALQDDSWKGPTNPQLPRGQCVAPADFLRVNECTMRRVTPFNYGKPVPHGARVTYVDEVGPLQGWMLVRCMHGELFIDSYDVTNCGSRPY